jgi:UDP-galactopyranose mutase
MSKNLIIGAGISGLSAALFLAQRGEEVHIREAAPRPGGLLRPVSFGGLRLDLGSHRIHPEAAQALSPLGIDWIERERRGVLLLGGEHVAYPPTLPGFLRGLGLRQSLQFAGSFLTRRASLSGFQSWERDRAELSRDVGFASFVTDRAGDAAYRAFYQPYAEKVFGVDASHLSQSVAKKRLSTSHPVRSLIDSFLHRHKTFLYPRGGIASLLDSLLAKAQSLGVSIEYNAPFSPDSSLSGYERVLFSAYPSLLVPQAKLSYRGLYLLFLSFSGLDLGEVDTFYIPEKRFWFGRVSIPQNFSEIYKKSGETILCVEIPQAQFGTDEDFTQKLDVILTQLREAKIVSLRVHPTQIKQIFLPSVYPLYLRGWLDEWRSTMRQICEMGNVFPFGRQGLFLHCNIDHCVQQSLALAEHLAQNKTPSEWISAASQYLDVRVRD